MKIYYGLELNINIQFLIYFITNNQVFEFLLKIPKPREFIDVWNFYSKPQENIVIWDFSLNFFHYKNPISLSSLSESLDIKERKRGRERNKKTILEAKKDDFWDNFQVFFILFYFIPATVTTEINKLTKYLSFTNVVYWPCLLPFQYILEGSS